MKTLKIAGIIVGAIAVLAVLAVTAALSSAVQTWAVRKAVAGRPGMTIEVARVEAGFSAAQITGLRVAQDGLVVTASSISTRHSAWAYLTRRRIDVDELIVKDLAVEIRPAATSSPATAATTAKTGRAPAGASGRTASTKASSTAQPEVAKATFEGLLKQVRLPVDLRLGRVAVNGKATLPDQRLVVYEVKGTGIEASQRGRLEWTVDFSDSTAGAAIRAIRSTGVVQFSLTRDRRVDAVEVESTSAAMGPNIPTDQLKLTAKVTLPVASGDENYAAGLSLIRGGKTESLLTATARYAAGPREVAGTWEIALRSDQLAALLAGFGLPEIAATGSGKFSVKPYANAAAASGTLHATAAQLQKLTPMLAAIGSVQVRAAFDGSVADNIASLNAFELELAESAGRPFAQIKVLQKVIYRLEDRRLTLADSKVEAARVTLRAVPLTWAQPAAKPMIIDGGELSLVLAVEGEPDGSRARLRAIEPLALRGVTVRDASKKVLVDNVTLTLRPNLEYGSDKLRAELGDLQLAMTTGDSLSGTMSAEVTSLGTKPATAFRAQLQAKLVTLLKPFLLFDPGTLTATLAAEGRHEGDLAHLTKAAVTIKRDSGALLAALELPQPVRADLKAQTFAAAKPDEIAARIRLGEIPLSWAEPYVAKSKLAGSIAGATLEVTMRSVDDLTVSTPEPFTLRAVTVSLEGRPLVQALDLAASLTATKRKDVVVYDLRRLELKQGATALAALSVAGEANLAAKTTTASAKGTLEADVAALMIQPALAPFATLARGRLSTAFEATVGDTTQAKAVVSARNLVAKQDSRALGDVELTLTASLKPDGSGSVSLPLTVLNGGRKSDLLVDGSFGKASDKTTMLFNGKVSSTNLVVDDLQMFTGLAPAGEPTKSPSTAAPAPATTARRPAAATAAAGKPARDTAPFWKGVNGRIEVDLKRILYGTDYTIRAIRGTATVANSRLALDNLEGNFRDKPFKLASAITFAATQPQPYALTGLVDVSGIDVGDLLKASSPKEKPMLETTVKVAAKLTGSGGTLPDLIERTYGTFDVSGGKGVLRALGRKGETVGAASSLLGLAGAITGSGNTMALGRLGQELEEMQFENFTLKVERDAALNMKFTAIEFLSPNKRLTGTGSVTHVKDAPFDQWPFQFEFKLAGKDFMAQLLNEARVLAGTKDEKGYYPMAASFPVSGTAAKVNNGLWKILAGSAVNVGLESLLRR